MAPQIEDDIFIEPANADDYDIVYGDTYDNDTMPGEFDRPFSKPYIRLNSILPNVTKNEGETIRLRCEAIGSPLPIRFQWFINHAPMEKKKGRQLRTREYWSRLRISSLSVHDRGYYTCKASNSAGSVETTAVVNVKAGVKRRKGDPPLDSGRRFLGGGGGGQIAGSVPGSVEGPSSSLSSSGSGSWMRPDLNDPNRKIRLVAGTCQEYQGEACKEFLVGQKVLITTTNLEEIRDHERQLKAAMMFISDHGEISAKCKKYSHKVACYHGYKVCDQHPQLLSISSSSRNQPPPTTLSLCQKDCEALQNDLCPAEYKLAEQHDLIGEGKLLPQCDRLETGSNRCIPVLETPETDSMQTVNPTHWCYVGNGKSYRGTASTTKSGKHCMNWSRAATHYSGVADSEVRNAGNYCRNPGGQKPEPWCYAAPDGQEEFCGLQTCPEGMFPHLLKHEKSSDSQLPRGGKPGTNFGGRQNKGAPSEGWFDEYWHSLPQHWQYTLIGGAMALFLLLIILALCCLCRRGKKRRRSRVEKSSLNGSLLTNGYVRNVNGHHHDGSGHGPPLEMSSLLPPPPTRSPPPPGFPDIPPEIPPGQLRLLEALGDGQFGKVWKGQLLGYENGNEEPMQVVVKSLKDDALPRQKKDFQQEAAIFANFRHQNVVELIGVCFNAQPQCTVFEYMIHGDLHEFLLLRSPYSQPVDCNMLDRERLLLDHSDFLHIATQIAAGMEYLASCHYVHRDLATRNCLVTDRLTIKISDFGVLRDQYVADYYPMKANTLMPIRWMPPEAIVYSRFSEQSDVWAYGVTVWEIYSYGTQPYYGYSNTEVVELIRTRCLLECPDNCPSRMYSLMVECWHEAAGRRPKFAELHGRLQTWSVLSSPAQSSALSAPHVPQPTRTGSVRSGASNGRTSRQSSSQHSGIANGGMPGAANSVASSVPRHTTSPYTGAPMPLQTMVTMNGIVPFSPASYQQAALNKNSPGMMSRNRPLMTSGGAYYGSGQLLNNNHHRSNGFDLDSSTSAS